MSTSTTAFPTILVPLDGSELAERALPVAEHLARATDSPLLLVQVIPVTTWAFGAPGGWVPSERYQELLDSEDRAARHYLSHTMERLQSAGLQARTLSLRGEPASTLIDLEPGTQVGLVVMATHGRTGLARFALGSIADRVAREGRAPVLLVRPRRRRPPQCPPGARAGPARWLTNCRAGA